MDELGIIYANNSTDPIVSYKSINNGDVFVAVALKKSGNIDIYSKGYKVDSLDDHQEQKLARIFNGEKAIRFKTIELDF